MSGYVLVVDDDASIRRLVQLMLEVEGIPVVTARDGEEAVRIALDETPALVVLDVMMPRLDGWAVCERLRAAPTTTAVPVVFLSALTDDDHLERGRALGVAGYVTKPFDVADLVDMVHELVDTSV